MGKYDEATVETSTVWAAEYLRDHPTAKLSELKGNAPAGVKIYPRLLPLARENLRRNRARSLLTMLGITIGVSAMLAMVTLGQFTKRKILATYEVLGVNRLGIDGWPNWELKAAERLGVQFRQFDMESDLKPLKRIFPEIRLLSPLVMAWSNEVFFGGRSLSDKVRVVGATSDLLEITDARLLAGRNITPYHVERKSGVCVLGYEIAARLFREVAPVDQMLSIKGNGPTPYACRVIGVLARVESNDQWRDPNYMVVTPYTYFQSQNGKWDSRIARFQLEIRQGADIERVGKSIKAYFERKYGKSGRFNVGSDAVLIAQMKRFLNLFTLMLGAIALISLVVGGIGIANMMLVSVSERLKEIGLRKAVGATSISVRVQFMVESVALCMAAGVAGLALGFVAYQGAIYGATRFVKQLKFEWVVEPAAALLSVGSIVLVGLASGIVPALKAEKLEVAEALRAE